MAIPLRDDQPTRRFPWVTVALIAINVIVFLFVQPPGFQSGGQAGSQDSYWLAHDRNAFTYQWGAVPCEVTGGKPVALQRTDCDKEEGGSYPASKSVLASLLTCMFLHGNIEHLAGNMLFLWVFGNNVEDRLGRANFLALYLLGGIAATLGFVAAHATSGIPLVGASGAIAVAMGAYLILFPRARVLTVIATAAFQIVYVPAAVVLALFFVTQFFTSEEEVAWEAHAAGMVVGILAALVFARIPAIKARAAEDAADGLLRGGEDF